jgi:hypothetical protein
MAIPEYVQGADLPDLALTWLDDEGDVIDFATGYTFQLKLGVPGSAASVTKTSGMTGASTAPNLTVAWADSAELNTLDPGVYTLQVKATRTSDSKHRFLRGKLRVVAAIS